jgi:nucleoside-diphosphate-sugar epimerase
MKLLLTGATGFVGSHTARVLREYGHEVHVLVRKSSRYQALQRLGAKLVFGDLDGASGEPLKLPQVDSVIHVAGLIKADHPKRFYDVNAGGTERLLDALTDQAELKRFVLVSSIAARGPNASPQDLAGKGPVSAYGKSKVEAEQIAAARVPAKNLVIIRPPIVYGPGDVATLDFFKMFKLGVFPIIGSGENRMSFIYVEDLARILMKAAATSSQHPGPYYPEDGRGGYPWKDVVAIASEIYGKKILPVTLPRWGAGLVATGSEFGSKLLRKTPMLTREKFREIREPFWFCPDAECRKVFKLAESVTIETGFKIAKEWYEKEGWV